MDETAMPALDFSRIRPPVTQASSYIFAVRALPDPQAMLRIANLFAQRDIIPVQICARLGGDRLVVDIEVALESSALASLLLEKLRALVLVERANLLGNLSK